MNRQPLIWFKTEEREGKTVVFDPLRRRHVALTPEEEVRQKTLYLMVEHLGVPAGRVAVEYSVRVNGMDRRADAVVFDGVGLPLMVVECKASSVTITDAVLDQAVRYHSALHPRYILLTNGFKAYCYNATGQNLSPMDHLPDYAEMMCQEIGKNVFPT